VSVFGSPSWCVPRKTVVVVSIVVVSVCCSALPDGQFGSSMFHDAHRPESAALHTGRKSVMERACRAVRRDYRWRRGG
jgi:hypothetical protein